MVILHVKHKNESQFLYQTPINTPVEDVIEQVTNIYNGRLKISRICYEIESLSAHGVALPSYIQGLNPDQVEELKLKDDWEDICIPSGGFEFDRDIYAKRNGRRPKPHMQEMLKKSMDEAKAIVSKKTVEANVYMTQKKVQEALGILRGAVTIVYPMWLPPHDPIRQEFENKEDLSGTQASKEVIDLALAQLWFSGKEMLRGKKLCDYLGNNDKTKIIVKLQSTGSGPPGREPCMTENEQKMLMLRQHQRDQELKKLEQDDDDQYHNSAWADSGSLKRQFQGMGNVSWKPK